MKNTGLLFVLAVLAALWLIPDPEVKRPPGVLVVEEPDQHDVVRPQPWEYKGFRVTPLAEFSIAARVLMRERYWLGREARISPMDLTLGWRLMSDSALLDKLRMYRGRRRFTWQPRARELPAKMEDIVSHSANMHMIPASEPVADALARLRRGHVVRFQGYLVQVDAPDGWRWRSSLSRTDTGEGACELVWVTRLAAE